MVKIVYKNNYDDLLTFNKYHASRVKIKQTLLWSVLLLLFAAFFVLLALNGNGNKTVNYVVAGISVAVSLIAPFLSFALFVSKTKKNIKNNPNFDKIVDTYEFDEEKILLKVANGKTEKDYTFTYKMVVAVYENKGYYYVYFNDARAFIVPKDGIEEGTIEELSAYFKAFLPENKLKLAKR